MKRIPVFLLAFGFVLGLLSQPVIASAIDYNKVIDNAVFDNANTMSAAQIDAFLNQTNLFPNSCISSANGFSAPDVLGYTPAAGFTYGNDVTAGTIIYHAAQAFGINPQVLLTTMEKEQGLITGTGGNVMRPSYDPKDCGALAISASLGYNCPDSLTLTPYSGFELYARNGLGSASLSGTTVTGNGTLWTSAMVGNNIIFPDGTIVSVTGFTSATSLTVTNPSSKTLAFQSYRTQFMYVQPTCVERASYVGFSRQVIISAWQLTFDRHRAEGANNWYVNTPTWDNSDDLHLCYSHKTAAGGPYYLCPDSVGHASDPFISHSGQYNICDSGGVNCMNITITNGATAALYNYTPHPHGQILFNNIFSGWFGSPVLGCGPSETPLPQVYSYYNPRTYDHFYTNYQCEASVLTSALGYRLDGPEYNITPSSTPGAVPIWRLYNPTTTQHLWTNSQEDINSATQRSGFRVEGIAFYTSPANTAKTAVWRLYNPKTYQHVWTNSQASINLLTQQLGFYVEGVAFYSQ